MTRGRFVPAMPRKATRAQPRAPTMEPLRARAGAPARARPEVRAWLQRFLHD